jgi:hypothetical protein
MNQLGCPPGNACGGGPYDGPTYKGLPAGYVPEHRYAPGMEAGRQFYGGGPIVGASPQWDRAFRVNGLGAIAAGATGTAVLFQWQFSGLIVGVKCCAVGYDNQPEAKSALGLSMIVGPLNQAVFANQSQLDYVPFAALDPDGYPSNFRRMVSNQEAWTITVKNNHAADTLTPDVVFLFQSPSWVQGPGQPPMGNPQTIDGRQF